MYNKILKSFICKIITIKGEKMRTVSSIKNLIFAFGGQFLGIIISFIARIIFLQVLNSEYLGINGLFTNILTILSLAELGIGTAMNFSLYKPLAEQNKEKIKSLMYLYKKAYIIIGIIILVVGIAISPLLPFFINEMPDIPENIYFIYILFVINTGISYFFSYKRALIVSDQKRYIATIYRYGFYFLLNVAQIICLLITRNYILFLVLQIIFTLLENIFVSIKANKMYPYLKEKNIDKLLKEETKEIKKNVFAMFFHKVGEIVVKSTDNIIISKFVSLSAVGLYSNYYLITNALNMIIGQVFTSIVASIGNLGATENKEKLKNIFNKVFFLNFWIFGFSAICLYILFNDFISLWLGAEYLLPESVMLVIVVSFCIEGMRKSVLDFRDALGIFWYDRYKPIFEVIINLIASIILVQKIGLAGVFVGTIISTLTTSFWVEPYVLYKYGFKMKLRDYFKQYLKYTDVSAYRDYSRTTTQISRFLIRFLQRKNRAAIIYNRVFHNSDICRATMFYIRLSVQHICREMRRDPCPSCSPGHTRVCFRHP